MALVTMFRNHVTKENELVLPCWPPLPTSGRRVLDGMHKLLGAGSDEPAHEHHDEHGGPGSH